ncbi:hypothetical protein LRE75_35805 [Streptomyces sp. 372A]
MRGANSPEALQAVAGMTPLGRLGEASRVAAVVALLTGAGSRWISGQNIRATVGLG